MWANSGYGTFETYPPAPPMSAQKSPEDKPWGMYEFCNV
jgi:hypothetical protein